MFMNFKLMMNPLNWLTIAIWLFVFAMVMSATGATTTPQTTKN